MIEIVIYRSMRYVSTKPTKKSKAGRFSRWEKSSDLLREFSSGWDRQR
jgi:hypothetical protein